MTARCVCAVCLHPLSGDDDCLTRFEARELWQCPQCKTTVIHGPGAESQWFRPVASKSPELLITNNTQHELDFSVHTVCGCPSASTQVWISESKEGPPVQVLDKRHAVAVQPNRLPSFADYLPPLPSRTGRSLLVILTGDDRLFTFDDWVVVDLQKSFGVDARWLLLELGDVAVQLAQSHERDMSWLSDLLSAGLEGGVQYWAFVAEGGPPTRRTDSLEEGPCFVCDWPLRGGSLTLVDGAESPPQSYTLDGAAISRGLPVFARECPHSFARVVTGEFDAADGDRFVQCCLFGKVVYA